MGCQIEAHVRARCVRGSIPRLAAWRSASALLVLVVTAGLAWGQPSGPPDASGVLTSLPVPGGTAALARLAGVDTATPRGILLLQIIRAVHDAPPGSEPARDQRLARFRTYLTDLSDFLRARSTLRDGRISAAQALSKESRRAVEDVARAVGGVIEDRGGVYRFLLRDDEESRRRRRNLEAAGLDVAALERDFNLGSSVTLAIASDDVPLPLGIQAWSPIVGPDVALSGSLLTALLGNRRPSLLYYGLMSLDADTRAFLGAHPSLVEKLTEGSRPGILASLGRSIRVRGGRVEVPGAPAATSAWEGLLQRRTTEPEAFILELLDREGGRAALLYDAIDHLDPPHQAFALDVRGPESDARAERLRALLAACAPSLAGWNPEARPFSRVSYDPVHLLAAARVLPTGELQAPAGRQFWSAVLSGSDVPDEPERLLKAGEPDRRADAAWLVDRICVVNAGQRQQMLKTWLFGQRAFAGLAPAALPQALVALRGFARFPMLLLTLERMGITDPVAYADAVRHARRLSEIGDREVAVASLRQFQSALAILGRLRFSRVISADVALRLVRALAAVQLEDNGEYMGGIGAWLDTHLLPSLTPVSERQAVRAGTLVSAEATLLAALAGSSDGASLPEIEWEGLRYRVDVAGAEFSRLVQVRRKQGGYALDDALALSRAVTQLGSAQASPAGVTVLAAALSSSVTGLLEHPSSAIEPGRGSAELGGLLGTAADDLRAVRSSKDTAKLTRVYRPLQRACDLLFASVMSAIAYAPHLGEPDSLELLAGDPAERHSFGFEERIPEIRAVNPWRMPQRIVGMSGGWRLTGSMLGLDVGLARLAVRRLETDGLPPPPTGNDIDRSALAAAVVLSNPFDVSDAERDELATAVRRGRARVVEVMARPSALPDLVRAARVNEWWREALLWAQAHEPGRVPDYFSLADLVRLGEAPASPRPTHDSWGAAWLETDGCLCLRDPPPGLRELLAGRMGTSLVTEQSAELPLRVAESLADLGLPAQLARFVMALAAQDVLDAYQPAYSDDWSALTAAVRRLPAGRFVDYVSALTSGGPLVPGDGERTDDVRR